MYTFRNTEINNKKATEFETKSLLYLFGICSDKSEIEVAAVDCFNDVTGSNDKHCKLWDVQSKNHAKFPPSKIAESLLTLYKNYVSKIHFEALILFIPKLKPEYLVDNSLNVYGFHNIVPKTQKAIKVHLKKVLEDENPPLLDDFLLNSMFVQDNKKISSYVKSVTKFKNKKIFEEDFYKSIFDDIKNAQSALKNNTYIEGKLINHPKEAFLLQPKRHITKKEIVTLIINRFLGGDVFSTRALPLEFLPELANKDIEDQKDLVQDCQSNLSRAFFDKNAGSLFWRISEYIIEQLKNEQEQNIYLIYDSLVTNVRIKAPYMHRETILYLISIIKSGMSA